MLRPNMQPRRKIIAPPGGWKSRTLYRVRVAFCKGNPVHTAVFYTGILDSYGRPGAGNRIWNPTSEDCRLAIENAYFLEAIDDLAVDFFERVTLL